MFEGKKERFLVMVCIILTTLSLVVNTVVGCIQRAKMAYILNYTWELQNINKTLQGIQKELDSIYRAIPR